MPELPEVETVRRGLMRLVGGATIDHVDVIYEKMVSPAPAEFKKRLAGATIDLIERRGKYLLFRFSNGYTMVSHLRMEGKYDVQPEGAPLTKHTHVVFHLTDNRELRYTDTRKFGRMNLVEDGDEMQVAGLKTIGPEPTEITLTFDYMKRIFNKSKKVIKPFLLDQSNIAGLGNIYVDEVLWMTRIHPEQPVNTLTDFQIRLLRDNILKELAKAIDGHGTTVHSFSTAFGEAGQFQNQLNVYGREGEPCVRCGAELQKTKVAQRGTHFCPRCQKLKKKLSKTVVLGLTGGIATGKSSVSAVFHDRDIPVIDADQIAREVVEPDSPALSEIAATFGQTMLQPDGTLNRRKLGQHVFNDEDELAKLNAITSPAIHKAVKKRVAAYRRKRTPLVVFDAPTLFEGDYAYDVDVIMVVALDTATQLARLMARDKMSETDARSRINSQLSLAEKVNVADIVVDNSGPIDKTKAQVVKWLNKMQLV